MMVARSCYVLLLLVLSSILYVEALSFPPRPGRCSLPKLVGPCKAAFPRWFFNTRTRRCERFIYGGCQGNANNFNSLAECLNTCNPSVLQCPRRKPIFNCLVEPCRFASCPGRPNAICINDYCGGCNARFFDYNGVELTSTCNTCKLPRVVGPCRAAIPRWFYNTGTKKCELFKYGGCKGNSNNFNQLADCLNTCAPSVLQCPPRTPVASCAADPCEVSTCQRFPTATCISDFCRGCNARYFNKSGCEITSLCNPPCNPKNCPTTTCPNPIPPGPNQCCPRCRQDCRVVLCLKPPCDNPIFPPGECCGVCPITISPPTTLPPTPPTCPIKGQVYKECGTACPPTCANPNPICTLQCQAGCICPTGTVLDTIKNVCVPQAKCTCPPTCSRSYCRKNPNSVCTNTGPREIPGCTGQCQLTFCRACYYSSSCFSRPTSCPTCYTRFTGKRLQRCLKYWAYCVRKKYHHRRVTKQQCPAGTSKFKCWNPPCPLRG